MTILLDATFEDGSLYQRPAKTGFEYVLLNGCTMAISGAAAFAGSYGVAVTPLSNSTRFAAGAFFLNNPSAQRGFRQRFYFHPNSLAFTTGNSFRIARNLFIGYDFAAYVIRLGYASGSYFINATAYNGTTDNTDISTTSNYNITNAWHYIESAFIAAVSGSFQVWVDGVSIGTISGDNHDACANAPSIGLGYPATLGFSVTGGGPLYFDNWRITDDPLSAIGA